jgi:Mechanosensitive ion channel MscS, C-terminal
VMTDGRKVSPPVVLFMGFGDSSLNFELRCFIREIDKRLTTLSDFNYAIEKKLRQAGVEIPFPQRDLHMRSISPEIGWQPYGPRKGDTPDAEDRQHRYSRTAVWKGGGDETCIESGGGASTHFDLTHVYWRFNTADPDASTPGAGSKRTTPCTTSWNSAPFS